MEYNWEELVRFFEVVLVGDDIGVDWDDLVLYLNSKDDFVWYWVWKIIVVEEFYFLLKCIELFNLDGFCYLKVFFDEFLLLGVMVKVGGGVILKVLLD